MAFYTTQFTIKTADANPENFATNTWHCEAADVTALILFNSAVQNFYAGIDDLFSDLALGPSGLTWKSYNKADPEPRAPVATGTATLTLGGGQSLPPELAMCVSFQALGASGVPQARRRGRIYIPFFQASANTTSGRPSTAVVSQLASAADTLITTSKAASTWLWVVYSPTTGASTEVDNGWVDNDWDIQRRRGRKYTTRTLFS